MTRLVGLCVGFSVLAIGFGLLERRWPAVPGKLRWRGRGTDVFYWLLTPLVTRPVTRAALILAAVAVALLSGATSGQAIRAFFTTPRGAGAVLPAGVQVVMVLVLGDVIGYVVHRAFHRGRLWRFHAVHHSARELDWLAATRVHPVNDVLGRLPQVAILAALGFRLDILAGYAPFLTLWAIFVHANVPFTLGPLRYVVASPTFHRWHHTSQEEGLDRNFAGLFPFIDVLFGTFHMPPGRQPERFGIAGGDVPERLLAQLAYPFRRPASF